MLAMTFSLIRHFPEYRDKQNAKDWSDCGKIISVEKSTIAVLGLGDIGSSYAQKVKALGAKKVIERYEIGRESDLFFPSP